MRSALAVLLAALLAVPTGALAADDVYPRVVRRDGRICVQTLDDNGQVEEACRREHVEWTGSEQRKAPPPAAREIADFRPDAPPARPRPQERAADPAAVGRADAERDGAGSYFMGGLVGGCLLGVIGCAGVTGLGLASDPVPPRSGTFGDTAAEMAYREAYQSEVRNKRALNAVIGGIIGTGIAALIIYAALNSAGEV
jgi:hypothetical protein